MAINLATTEIKTYEFNNSGNLIAETTDRIKDGIYEKKIFKYDDNENKIAFSLCSKYVKLTILKSGSLLC